MENKNPISLTIIAWLFVVGGTYQIFGTLLSALVGKVNFLSLATALCLPVGAGLLKTRPWAHLGAMILMCLLFIFVSIGLFTGIFFEQHHSSAEVSDALILQARTILLFLGVLSAWCIFTLNKESIRNLFKR